jgi:hypothetical protein
VNVESDTVENGRDTEDLADAHDANDGVGTGGCHQAPSANLGDGQIADDDAEAHPHDQLDRAPQSLTEREF